MNIRLAIFILAMFLVFASPNSGQAFTNQDNSIYDIFDSFLRVEDLFAAPEMDVRWYDNQASIVDGDTSPSTNDGTDFGSANVDGERVIHSFQIHNTGDANLNLTGNPKVEYSGCDGFSAFSQPGSPVVPGGHRTFSVEFDPNTVGLCTATLSIANDDADENPYNFTIQGMGTGALGPEMDVKYFSRSIADGDSSPSWIDGTFFSAVVSGDSDVNIFYIHNTGDSNLNLTGDPKVELSGCNDFVVHSQPVTPVLPGDNNTFSIEFKPSTYGLCDATLSISNDDADENPYNFSIQGRGEHAGPEIDVRWSNNGESILDGDNTPSPTDGTDFGTVFVSGDSVTHIYEIHNTGESDLLLTGSPKVHISGCNDFSVTSQPSTPVAPGSYTPFSVEFNPDTLGLCVSYVEIDHAGSEVPFIFTIQGIGNESSEPEIDVRWLDNDQSITDGDTTPSTTDGTDFGSAPVIGGSVIHTFQIHNTGDADLNLTGDPKVVISGCSGFSTFSQPFTPVYAGGHRTFSVKFDPTSSGDCIATLSIANDDANENPYNFTITGIGTSINDPICYPLNLIRNGSGTVPSATPTNSTGCPLGQFVENEAIKLEAIPSDGWHVASWEGTDNDSNTSTINSLSMPGKNHTVIVNYHPISLDIGITHLEINQATQDETNSIKLVANKNTSVRVYISTNTEVNGITGLLKVINGTTQVPGSPFEPVNNAEGKITVYKNPQPEKNADHTLNFNLPGESLDPGSYLFQVELIFNGDTIDTFEITRPLIKKGTINILYYPIRVKGKGLPSHYSMMSSYHFIRQTFPVGINSVQLIPGGSTLEWPYSYISSIQYSAILTRLSGRLLRHNLFNSSLKADYVAGFAPIDSMDSAGAMNPILGLTGKSVLVEDKKSPRNVSITLAHEIGHYFGLGDEYDGALFWAYRCNINPPSEDVNSPCNQNDPGNRSGTFVSTKAFDVDRMIPAAYVYVPNVGSNNPFERTSFMGGITFPDLHDRWVTDRVYEHLIVHQDLDPKTDQKESISSSQYLVLSGTINKNDTVDLDPFYIVSGSNTSSSFAGDGYSLELLDNSDLLLSSYTFSVSFKVNSNPPLETDSAPFSFVVPYPLGTKKIQIKHGDMIISTILASDNSPSVTVISPNGGRC